MSIIRKNVKKKFVLLDREILLHPKISLEGIGAYGMIEAGISQVEDFPPHIINEFIDVGYLVEEKE